jgi:hypothetical protein
VLNKKFKIFINVMLFQIALIITLLFTKPAYANDIMVFCSKTCPGGLYCQGYESGGATGPCSVYCKASKADGDFILEHECTTD